MANEMPKVGVGVIVHKDDKVLLGLRLGKHGQNTWSFPGGHLEFQETINQCATREVDEETGLKIKNLKQVAITNDIFPQKHYITIFVEADYESGEITNKEPDKCKEWKWFKWNELPTPLFLPIQNLIKQGFKPQRF